MKPRFPTSTTGTPVTDTARLEIHHSYAGRGPIWAWLRIASSGWNRRLTTTTDLDKFRRSQMCAWFILLVSASELILLQGAFEDRPTLIALIIAFAANLATLLLNRAGWVTFAGATLVASITFCIVFGVYGAPGHLLTNDYLPSLFLYILPAVIAAALLPSVLALCIQVGLAGLLTAHILLQPLGADVQAAAAQYGLLGVIDRQLFLFIILAGVTDLILLVMRRADERADFAVDTAKAELEFNTWLDWFLSLIEDRIEMFIQSPNVEVRLSDLLKTGKGAPGTIPDGMIAIAVKFDIQLRRIRARLATADDAGKSYHAILNALTRLGRDLEVIRQGHQAPQSLGQLRIGIPPFDSLLTQIEILLRYRPATAPGAPAGAPGYASSTNPFPPQSGNWPAAPYTPPADASPSPPPTSIPTWRGGPPASSSSQPGQGALPPDHPDWRR